MGMLKDFRIFSLPGGFALTVLLVLGHAQDHQTGFISLDCGLPEYSSYSDQTTDIHYTSDASYVNTGEIMSVSPEFITNVDVRRQLWTVRSFPDGDRNCFHIRLTAGVKYLIRGTFMYGNYDSKDELPVFDLHLGPNKWDSLKFESASAVINKEIIHIPSSNYIHVCLINTNSGTPFISALELRTLRNFTYVSESGSLALVTRTDTGATKSQTFRYKDDKFDRIWTTETFSACTSLNTSLNVNAGQNDYEPPSVVMSTAASTKDANTSLDFYWDAPPNDNSGYYIYMHFAEVEELAKVNQYRAFIVTINGNFWHGPVVPDYLLDSTVSSQSALTGAGTYSVSLKRTENSTLPPIINAFEIYKVIELLQNETDQDDVDAINNTKLMYGVKRNWQGDPCFPPAYVWNGLECSSGGYNNTARITSLNLSSSGLTGRIAPYISILTMLVSLDLSNNSLNGPIPDFLSQLPSLKVLKLEKNNLTGSVPVQLIEKSKNRSLSLSVDPNLCSSASCGKKSIAVIAAVASVAGLAIVILLTAAAIFWSLKRRKRKGTPKIDAETNNQNRLLGSEIRQFTYSDILNITNNLQRTLGKGGFGTVYHGYIDGTHEVAVKMLSPSSAQGYREFEAEVKLLTRVHHRNLTTLFGYCHEEAHMGLIYEYMANGNLADRNTNTPIMTWDDRLRVALDAAQGLEYLHNGCRPPIIHRDVKSTNILLNENLQAKLADFGQSKVLPSTDGSHVFTIAVGTVGYLDPEYGISNRLTEKSDVYSFGVVLLEIITGRPVVARNPEKTHVSKWVSFMLAKGDIKSIVDPRLQGDFHVGSAWKAVEIAMNCVSPTSARRPAMSEVATGLTECVSTARNAGYENESRDSIPLMNLNLTTTVNPVAR